MGAAFVVFKLLALWLSYLLLDHPESAYTPASYFQRLSLSWDGIHYLNIAKEGYEYNTIPELSNPFAFAPAFPLLIKIFGAQDLTPFFVSNALSVAAVLVVAQLMGWRAGLFFALFPTWAATSSFGYTESLYVTVAALALLSLQRAQWAWTGLLTGLAVATRYGSAVAFLATLHPLIQGTLRPLRGRPWLGWREAFPRLRWTHWVTFALPSLVFVVALLVFFKQEAGSYTAYFQSQRAWDAGFVWPWEQIDWYLHGWFTNQPAVRDDTHPSYWVIRNYVFVALSALGVYYLWAKDQERTWALFGGFTVLLVLSMHGMPAISTPRLLLMGFPAIAILGRRLVSWGAWVAYGVIALLGTCWVVVGHMEGFFA